MIAIGAGVFAEWIYTTTTTTAAATTTTTAKNEEDGANKCKEEEEEETKKLIESGMEDIISQINEARRRCISCISSRVSRDCLAFITVGVPRIKLKYSMTGETAPKVPSSYVSSVLEPLKKHLLLAAAAAEGKGVDKEEDLQQQQQQQRGGGTGGANVCCRWLADAVVASVCSKYVVTAKELLQVVAKTEAILSRLKKNKKQQASTASSSSSSSSSQSMSDADKIRLQLQLDITAFASQVRVLLGSNYRLKELEDLEQLIMTKK